MPSITLVGAPDFERWATSRSAQEQIPALVRRLIHATTSTATHVGLPAGDAVQQGGYDGVVVIDEPHHTIPNGMSIWEFGVARDSKGKADEEYEKRKSKQPHSSAGPVDPASTTFVFVTPRRWNAKTKWLETRRAEGFWNDVRVLDADDLEAWLEQAPATHIWLSTLLGRRPAGADDLEAVWQDWSESTMPSLSPGLMFAGRESTRDKIRDWFTSASEAHTLGVESESPDETIALVGAALMSLPENDRTEVLSRTVVVRDPDAFAQLAAADEPLYIVATFPPEQLAQRATRHGHRVLIPRSPGESVTGTLHVPRLHRHDVERELKAMGLSADRARELAGVARRSLMALRRRLAANASVSQPAWAKPELAPSVLPIFFLGTVNDDVPGDVEVLSFLAGEVKESALARLARLAAESDPPVRRVGNVWYLVSKEDSWDAMSRYIRRDTLDRFATVALTVLGTPDPSYELPLDQRWAAGIFEKNRAHTELLARGVADTLALLGSRGGGLSIAPGVSAADLAAQTVRKLFEHAGRDWQRWASFAFVFPLLIEAAPDAMLEAIEIGLGGANPSPVIGLFEEAVGVFGSARYTHLLWALERVSWSPDYLSRAVLILAELARRAPRGELTNQPSASLRSIFLPWAPGTAASMETRLAVIDTVRQHEEPVAWELMAHLLPKLHDHTSRTSSPDWREWAPEGDRPVTHRTIAEHAAEVVNRMLQDAGRSSARWQTLVEALADLPQIAHEAILSRLSALAGESLPAETRAAIWNALRQLLSNHRSYPDADWALPAERVNVIAGVFAQFEPNDLVVKYGYLFSHHSALPEGREQDFAAYRRLVSARRIEAARAWYGAFGSAEIVRLGANLERADALGEALAESKAVPVDEESTLLRLALEHSDFPARVLGRAYLFHRFTSDAAAIRAFLHERGREWPARTRAEALLAISPESGAWVEVDALDDEGRTHYWRNVGIPRVENADLTRALSELVRYGRPHAAVDLAAMHLHQKAALSAADVNQVLHAAASVSSDANGYRSENYDVSELISFLEREAEDGRIAEEDVARLELIYLAFLRHDRVPTLLHKIMGKDPSLFVQATCLAYRGEGEVEQELDEAMRRSALVAYQLLSSWRTPPGYENGLINGDPLKAWVEEARQQLADKSRVAIGDELIGQLLSGSPVGADGAWPAEPVRALIERLNSDDLEGGLHTGRFNSRGVVTRNPLSGGALERSITAQYEADAAKVAARWPRTAAFLRTLAATYARYAAREDVDAELRQDLEP